MIKSLKVEGYETVYGGWLEMEIGVGEFDFCRKLIYTN